MYTYLYGVCVCVCVHVYTCIWYHIEGDPTRPYVRSLAAEIALNARLIAFVSIREHP